MSDYLIQAFKSLIYADLAINRILTGKDFTKDDWRKRLSEEDQKFLIDLSRKIRVDYESLQDSSWLKTLSISDFQDLRKIKQKMALDKLKDKSTTSSGL